jgi:hypothetical protein
MRGQSRFADKNVSDKGVSNSATLVGKWPHSVAAIFFFARYAPEKFQGATAKVFLRRAELRLFISKSEQ